MEMTWRYWNFGRFFAGRVACLQNMKVCVTLFLRRLAALFLRSKELVLLGHGSWRVTCPHRRIELYAPPCVVCADSDGQHALASQHTAS